MELELEPTYAHKQGVSLKNLNASIYVALFICNKIFEQHGYKMVVTSTKEGIHKHGSLHYQGLAVDLRTRHLDDNVIPLITEEIEKNLKIIDVRFQTILESTHIHIEFDRRYSNVTSLPIT